MDELKPCPFQEAHDYLENYYRTHAVGLREVINSQWTRGVVSGRSEALNILKEAIDRRAKEQG